MGIVVFDDFAVGVDDSMALGGGVCDTPVRMAGEDDSVVFGVGGSVAPGRMAGEDVWWFSVIFGDRCSPPLISRVFAS